MDRAAVSLFKEVRRRERQQLLVLASSDMTQRRKARERVR